MEHKAFRFLKQFLRFFCVFFFAFESSNALFSFAHAERYTTQSLSYLLVYILMAWQMWLLWDEGFWKKKHRRITWASLALALCFGLLAAVGRLLRENDALFAPLFKETGILSFFQLVIGMAAMLFMMLWRFLSWAVQTKTSTHGPRPVLFWFLLLGLVLCWFPTYLALFPGIMSPDSFAQIEQVLGLAPLNDAHPLVHTWSIAACFKIGQLFGMATPELPAVYSALQMLFLGTVCAYAVYSLFYLKVRSLFAWLCYAFFALYPVHAILGVTMWKDIPHAAVTLLLVTLLFRWMHEPQEAFRSWRRVAVMVSTLFLFATVRHNGILAFSLLCPCFVWRFRFYWKRALALLMTVCALLFAYRIGLLVMDVQQFHASEALSVPVQMTARMVRDRRDAIPPEDEAAIREILPFDSLPFLYEPGNADPVKGALHEDALLGNPGRYISLFARLIARHPGVSLEAFLLGNYGYWYPEAKHAITAYAIAPNNLGMTGRSMIPRAQEYLRRWVEEVLRVTPGISMMFSIGIMVWILMLAASTNWVKRYRSFLPFVPLLGIWLTLLCSPIFAEYRYAYALILCAPVCLCAMLGEAPPTGDTAKEPVSSGP